MVLPRPRAAGTGGRRPPAVPGLLRRAEEPMITIKMLKIAAGTYLQNLPENLQPDADGNVVLMQHNRRLACWGFLLLFIALYALATMPLDVLSERPSAVRFYTAFLVAAPFMLGWSLGLIHRGLFARKPGLMLTPQGLADATWPGAYGLIPWEDIADVRMDGASLKITVRNARAYRRRLRWWQVPVHLCFYFSLSSIYLYQFLYPFPLPDLKKCLDLYLSQRETPATPPRS